MCLHPEFCNNKLASHISNFSFEVQNIEQLDFPSKSFGAVTCFGLFPHLENKQEALCGINHVLKPGGKLIIVHALNSAGIKAHHHIASGAVAHDALPNNSEMRRLLKQAAFARIRITDKPGCYLCQSYKSFVLN